MIRVFIGFDPGQTVAFHVLSHSILSRSSIPVSITPVSLAHLDTLYGRSCDPKPSTDFSFSRFLTPYLSDYTGWSIFLGCNMLMLDDIAKLWALRDEYYAVQVIKHNLITEETNKYQRIPQSAYARQYWSSVMLLNNARCTALTPEYVNQASGLDLHRLGWLPHDGLIGPLPCRWNHLVGYDQPRENTSLVHYTIGGPYFEESKCCEYSQQWFDELDCMLFGEQPEGPLSMPFAMEG
mgnify:CR=1 FL=1